VEVVTLAFATLTDVIYYFWWDKPLDVRCSIPVQLLEGRLEKIQDNVVKEDTGSQIIKLFPIPRSLTKKRWETFSPTHSHHPWLKAAYPFLIQPLTRMQRFQAFRRRARRTKHGTVFGLGYVFIVFPLKRFFQAFDETLNGETLGDKTLRAHFNRPQR
jgi:hypothetical protein